MNFRKVGALAGVAILTFAACSTPGATTAPSGAASPGASGGTGLTPTSPKPAGDSSKGTVTIAIELPQQGSEKAATDPIINGIKLAVKLAGGTAGGYAVEIPQSAIYDDALNGAHDPQTGANNMSQIVADEATIAVIGPLNSNVGAAQIPISNEAGLLQCSPANTNPDLTKGAPAADLRTKPNNYIRVTTTDDVQGPAAAQYLFEELGKKSVYIIDDTETFGKGVADAFDAEFVKRGGTVVKHDAAPKTTQDYVSIMTAAKALNPEAIYFGGVTATGGARILLAAEQAGLGDVPYVGPDGINDGSGETKDSFLNLAGASAKNSYSTLAGIGDFPGKAQLDVDYKNEFGIDATGYAGMGYACAQIVLDALERAGAEGAADMAALREAVRVAGTATDVTYSTVLGDITFDENGDTSQKIVSIYSVDTAGANGKGDWKFETQVEYE
ncbi:MAG TPA: branched-chain amino acid ABC transporter substrate-binding protein [Candidatus Limnocylindrales bacterium]|nr:branched-chain amino acid ABC transporter substrate-binding protein [Candidatus Limnocylindrales bacterium]